MDDLVAFLRARLDEEEQAARAAIAEDDPGRWEMVDDHLNGSVSVLGQFARGAPLPPPTPTQCGDWYAIAEWSDRDGERPEGSVPYAEHIARWDPARVLAEVEAKRAIVDLLARQTAACPEDDWSVDGGIETAVLADNARYLLRLLVASYAEHPDFDSTWR